MASLLDAAASEAEDMSGALKQQGAAEVQYRPCQALGR